MVHWHVMRPYRCHIVSKWEFLLVYFLGPESHQSIVARGWTAKGTFLQFCSNFSVQFSFFFSFLILLKYYFLKPTKAAYSTKKLIFFLLPSQYLIVCKQFHAVQCSSTLNPVNAQGILIINKVKTIKFSAFSTL